MSFLENGSSGMRQKKKKKIQWANKKSKMVFEAKTGKIEALSPDPFIAIPLTHISRSRQWYFLVFFSWSVKLLLFFQQQVPIAIRYFHDGRETSVSSALSRKRNPIFLILKWSIFHSNSFSFPAFPFFQKCVYAEEASELLSVCGSNLLFLFWWWKKEREAWVEVVCILFLEHKYK